jgi:hypothetical protein
MVIDLNLNVTANSLYEWTRLYFQNGHPLHDQLADEVEWIRSLGRRQYEYNLRHGIVYSFEGNYPPALIPNYIEETKKAPQPQWYSNMDTRAEEMMKVIRGRKKDTARSVFNNRHARYLAARIRLNYLHEVAGLVLYNQGALDEFYDHFNDQDRYSILLDGGVPLQMGHYTTGFREYIGDPTVRPPHTLETAWTIRQVLLYCYPLVLTYHTH